MHRTVDFVHNDFVHEAASLPRPDHLAAFFETADFLASRVAWSVAEGLATSVHAVRFYENRESLAKIVGTFLGEGFGCV